MTPTFAFVFQDPFLNTFQLRVGIVAERIKELFVAGPRPTTSIENESPLAHGVLDGNVRLNLGPRDKSDSRVREDCQR